MSNLRETRSKIVSWGFRLGDLGASLAVGATLIESAVVCKFDASQFPECAKQILKTGDMWEKLIYLGVSSLLVGVGMLAFARATGRFTPVSPQEIEPPRDD